MQSSHTTTLQSQRRPWIIFTLGLLTALSPFSIDMYLPAFPQIARDLHTTTGDLALSLSSYFTGLAFGQLFYGPLLDRFGRKKPLYAGLLFYVLASVGCMLSKNLETLVFWRFLAGAGGCVASVASIAIVRDLFTTEESSKVFSLIILVVGASPLLAPMVGSIVAIHIGWQALFALLIIIALLILAAATFILPESHPPDQTIHLSPIPITRDYIRVFMTSPFAVYSLAGAISFAALFSYIAASPALFFNFFKVDATTYSWIFTLLAAGFIGASQMNIVLLRHFKSLQILKGALCAQGMISLLFLVLIWNHWITLTMVLSLLFPLLLSIGLVSPNAAVLAMAPFTKKAGSASALLSFFQMLLGTIASIGVGCLHSESLLPIGLILIASPLIAGGIVFGKKLPNQLA